jgi:hypothetical protein
MPSPVVVKPRRSRKTRGSLNSLRNSRNGSPVVSQKVPPLKMGKIKPSPQFKELPREIDHNLSRQANDENLTPRMNMISVKKIDQHAPAA